MKVSALLQIAGLVLAMGPTLAQPAYTLDPGFAPVITLPGVGTVKTVAVRSDGSAYVAGSFAAIDGISRPSLVRIKASGGVDASFRPAQVGGEIELQPDGKLLVARSGYVTRLNPDGRLDLGFQAEVPAHRPVEALLVQDDGKILVGLGPEPSLIIRLNSTGRRDSSFTPVDLGDGSPSLTGMLVQPDGRIVVWGYFSNINGKAHRGIARLDADGSIDPGFRHTLQSEFPEHPGITVGDVTLLPDGKLFVTGYLKGGGHLLNADGSTRAAGLNGGFGPNFLLADGRIISNYDGQFTRLGGHPEWSIETDGNSRYRSGRALALLPDGSVLMEAEGEIKKVTRDGALDPSFSTTIVEVPGQVGDLIEQTDGKVVLKGAFTRVNGVPQRGIARLNPDGTLDPSFAPDPKVPGFTRFDCCYRLGRLRYQPWDGKLVVLGSLGGNLDGSLVRLNPNGSLDVEFALPESFGWIVGLEPQADGTVYVASWSAGAVVRLKADGSSDPGFRWEGSPTAIAPQSDGKLLIAQPFDDRNPQLIRLNADGSPDAAFICNLDWEARHILLQADGRIVVAGSPGEQFIARFNRDGTPDLSFGEAGSLLMDVINDVSLLDGSRIAVFGSISSIGSGKCLFADCASANFVLLNANGQFEGEAGFVPGAGLPLADGGFLLAGFGLDLVRVQPSPVLQSSHRNPDGSMGLRIGGRADWIYSLESSTNLVNWTPLRDVPSEGLTTSFRDTPPAGDALRFYRAALKR